MKVIEEVEGIKKEKGKNNWKVFLFLSLLIIFIVVITTIWIFPNIIAINGEIYPTILIGIYLITIIGCIISSVQLLINLRSSGNKRLKIKNMLGDLKQFEDGLDPDDLNPMVNKILGDGCFIQFQAHIMDLILIIESGNSELMKAYNKLCGIYSELAQNPDSAEKIRDEIKSALLEIKNIWIICGSTLNNHFDPYLYKFFTSTNVETSTRNYIAALRGRAMKNGQVDTDQIKTDFDLCKSFFKHNNPDSEFPVKWEDVEGLATSLYGT